MLDLLMPNDTSDEMAKTKELKSALDSAQVPYEYKETDEGHIFTVEDDQENHLINAAEAIGVYVDSSGADAEDAWGAGEDIYRTESYDTALCNVLEGADPLEVINQLIET